MVGIVRKRQERMNKRGKRFAFLMLSDPTGDYEVMVFEELLATEARPDEGRRGGAADGEDRKRAAATGRLSLQSMDVLRKVKVAEQVKGLSIRLRSATRGVAGRLGGDAGQLARCAERGAGVS